MRNLQMILLLLFINNNVTIACKTINKLEFKNLNIDSNVEFYSSENTDNIIMLMDLKNETSEPVTIGDKKFRRWKEYTYIIGSKGRDKWYWLTKISSRDKFRFGISYVTPDNEVLIYGEVEKKLKIAGKKISPGKGKYFIAVIGTNGKVKLLRQSRYHIGIIKTNSQKFVYLRKSTEKTLSYNIDKRSKVYKNEFKIIKIDMDNNIVWEKLIHDDSNNIFMKVVDCDTTGSLLVFNRESAFSPEERIISIEKYNNNGDLLFKKDNELSTIPDHNENVNSNDKYHILRLSYAESPHFAIFNQKGEILWKKPASKKTQLFIGENKVYACNGQYFADRIEKLDLSFPKLKRELRIYSFDGNVESNYMKISTLENPIYDRISKYQILNSTIEVDLKHKLKKKERNEYHNEHNSLWIKHYDVWLFVSYLQYPEENSWKKIELEPDESDRTSN